MTRNCCNFEFFLYFTWQIGRPFNLCQAIT